MRRVGVLRTVKQALTYTHESAMILRRNIRHFNKLEKLSGVLSCFGVLLTTAISSYMIGQGTPTKNVAVTSFRSLLLDGFVIFTTSCVWISVVEAISRNALTVAHLSDALSVRTYRFQSRVRSMKEIYSFLAVMTISIFLGFLASPLRLKIQLLLLATKMCSLVVLFLLTIAAKLHQILMDIKRQQALLRQQQGQEQYPRLNIPLTLNLETMGRDLALAQYQQLVFDLQHRDLTPEDYTILQQLDTLLNVAANNDSGNQITTGGANGSIAEINIDNLNRAVKALPVFTVGTKLFRQYRKGGRECCVCLEKLKKGDRVKVSPCLHRGHEACMDTWLQMKSSCPVCLISLDTVEEDTNRSLQELALLEESN